MFYTIQAVIRRGEQSGYVAECLELYDSLPSSEAVKEL